MATNTTFTGRPRKVDICLNELAFGSGAATVTENLTKVGGTNVSVGSGTTDAGTLRVILPTDQAAISIKPQTTTQIMSTALETSHVLKASAGNLVELSIFNSKASSQFILVMNSTTVPADGAVALLYPPIPIAAASLVVLDIPYPLVASTGIAVCNSSTGSFTKTIGSADCAFFAEVI
jgi:hypothetical protein